MKYILLIGIGGSNMGTKAVYDALRKPEQQTRLLCADNIAPATQQNIFAELKNVPKGDVTIIYISKSGTTLESKINLELFKDYAGKIVDIYKELDFDKSVSGRFSVFIPVGTYPLKMLGFDVNEFLRGKEEANEEQAKQSSEWLYEQLQAGFMIHDLFVFNPELETLGKWYRQLLGESTGKDGKGYFPVVSVGSTDLHSIHQRIMGGPKDVVTTFVQARVPNDTIITTIREAVQATYKSHGLSFQEYIMPKLDEYELGKFMQFKMYEVIHLAELMGVDPFTQPDVEEYKNLVKNNLGDAR